MLATEGICIKFEMILLSQIDIHEEHNSSLKKKRTCIYCGIVLLALIGLIGQRNYRCST